MVVGLGLQVGKRFTLFCLLSEGPRDGMRDAKRCVVTPVPFFIGSLSTVIVSQLSVVLRSQVLGRPGQEFIGFMSVLAL